MRIARVVTICAALISTIIGADTQRPKRRSQPKNHLSPPRIENISTTPITFTTLQPELRSFSSQIDASVHPIPRRRPRIRASRFATIRLRETNRPKNTRHRRQLHRRGKKSRLGRSFDISDTKTIETVHVPPKVSEEIRIEPIIRVTKNKGVLDSIIDAIRRLIGTEKTQGPLVGPFHFPGVGEKVYVRLLDPVLPDHLVIRFVSHSPITKVESPIGKDISLPIQIAKHPEIIPAIAHESFVLSPNEFDNFGKHSAVASISSDSFLSSSNKVQASKPSFNHKFLGSWPDNVHVPRTYGVNLTNTYQPSSLNNVDWNFEPVNSKNKDHQINSYQDSFNQVYQSGTENPGLKYDVQDFHDPFNASDFQAENPFVPVRDYNVHDQLQFEKQFEGPSESSQKYSLDFVSKKMRYLNLDGSVSDEKNEGGFKPMEAGPTSSKRVIRKIQVRRKEVGATNEKDRMQGSGEIKSINAFSEVNRKIDDDNVFRNKTRPNAVDRKEHFPNFGRFQNESRSTESPGNIKPVLMKEQSKNSTDSRTI